MYVEQETKKVRSEKYYSVGYNSVINKYLLAVVIPWVAWYERYYEITEYEYELFGTEELDAIAKRLYDEGTESKKFLFSDKNEENTREQLEMRCRAKLN